MKESPRESANFTRSTVPINRFRPHSAARLFKSFHAEYQDAAPPSSRIRSRSPHLGHGSTVEPLDGHFVARRCGSVYTCSRVRLERPTPEELEAAREERNQYCRAGRLRVAETAAAGAGARPVRLPAVQEASAYAELTCDRWYDLSAKHGLLHPDTVIEPYDIKLDVNHRTAPPIHQWAAKVREQLEVELAGIENVRLLILADEQYRYAACRGPRE
jgi:hypothetical protein